MEENANKLHFECTDFNSSMPVAVYAECIFVCNEDKVSGILRELMKQKLSVLHASNAIRICQLLCMAPLETFQTQVLTNNPGHR